MPTSPAASVPFDPSTARSVVDDAISRYIDSRRERINPFVDAHYGWSGSARLHRNALGLDLVRAPLNVALVPPQLLVNLSGMVVERFGARRAGHWMKTRRLLMRTSVDRELEWRLWTELLELPFTDGVRISTRDALAEAMFADPRLHRALGEPLAEIARHAEDPDVRCRVEETLAAYTGTRAAASDLVGAMMSTGVGYAAAHQITPSVWTLGPVLAGLMAHNMAVASFPLGATLGSAWYGAFPATVSTVLVGTTIASLAAVSAIVAAFAGVLADPLQRSLGLHRRRLNRMLDTVEKNFRGQGPAAYTPRDHYVARLVDAIDVVRVAHRVATST
ncbi:MAG: hypothetical protein P1U88_05495 [Thalassobaculaceae bacterium]|nr:hypothetical protein [Thalassobaculaceae bacterium]